MSTQRENHVAPQPPLSTGVRWGPSVAPRCAHRAQGESATSFHTTSRGNDFKIV